MWPFKKKETLWVAEWDYILVWNFDMKTALMAKREGARIRPMTDKEIKDHG